MRTSSNNKYILHRNKNEIRQLAQQLLTATLKVWRVGYECKM
jgi:hypothetical protein